MTLSAGDSPITDPVHDQLDRAGLVKALSDTIIRADTSHGLVIGLLGEWGSGKTSVINLVRRDLVLRDGKTMFVEFNPWLFSGSHELMERLFDEIANQIGAGSGTHKRIANTVHQYSQLLKPLRHIPVGGPIADVGREVVEGISGRIVGHSETLNHVRSRLSERLSQLERPIVITIDDIDRLRTDEIREIFQTCPAHWQLSTLGLRIVIRSSTG